ncbi:Fic family protein [Nostoc sp. CHAB 5824]|nr:Fic family protein [Nostoc sp. CHAB 5824]
MVGDPYEAFDDPACYPGSRILRNIPDLRDADALEDYEIKMVALRSEEGLPMGDLGPAHYRAIHRHLFQDIYVWAGEYRTIRTAKGGNPFCYPEYIQKEMEALFARLSRPEFQPGSEADEFVAALADFVADLNAIHPFREGNGRTQLLFIRMLGQNAGHLFRSEAVEAEEFLTAMILSFDGQLDPLVDELERMLA